MSRILGLDILRCIAILLVILMHSSHFLTPIFSFPYLGILIRRFAGIMNFLGELGVELFFILSGFLIGGILIKTFEKTNFDFKEIKNFWVRRWFRTLPNYLLFLLLNIVFFVFILKENSFYPQYFFFLQNFTDKIYPFFKESWSLSIEEWFYLSLPIILFFVRRLLNKRSIKKQLLISFIIYFLVFFLLKVYAVFIIDVPETRGIVIYRLDTMVIGVFMSYFYKYYEKSFINNKMKLFLFGILIFFVLFCLLVASAFPNFNLNTNYWYDKFHKILMLDLFGISFAMLIPLAISIQTTKFKTFNYIVTTISVISYSLYLIHFSILDVLIFSRLNNTTPISSLIIYISYFVVAFVSSYIVYKYFEIPITKMREKVSNKE